MIAFIEGEVREIGENKIVLLVGAFGLEIGTPAANKLSIGEKLSLYTHLVWSSESGPALFGFNTENKRKLFQVLLSCSGIGPRMGLAILANYTPPDIVSAVRDGNTALFSSVSGIGTKKAESMVFQLRSKLKNWEFEQPSGTGKLGIDEVSQALSSLGYSRQEIQGAIKHILETRKSDRDEGLTASIRVALSFLAKS